MTVIMYSISSGSIRLNIDIKQVIRTELKQNCNIHLHLNSGLPFLFKSLTLIRVRVRVVIDNVNKTIVKQFIMIKRERK